jgi:hypothetical protein
VVIHRSSPLHGFIPVRQTAATGQRPQGLELRKWLSGHGKRHLSTEKAAFYYYDYVFIEALINNKQTTPPPLVAPGGMAHPE